MTRKLTLGIVLAFACAVAFVGVTLLTLPNVKTLESCIKTSMYKVNLCPGTDNYVKLKDISPHMVNAVLAAEDAAFYSHKGFDWYEMKQSFSSNLEKGKISRGGSTLTQQLAKNVFLNKEKSYWRKFKEAYLTMSLEKTFSKDFILEKYLNVVEFGPNIYGVRAAARHYFHKHPSQLHPLESVFLAFLLPNPKAYSKSFSTGQLTPFARRMVGVLLKRLLSFRKLSLDAYQFAVQNISAFPWSGISLAEFSAPPTGVDVFDPATMNQSEEVIDEDALEELLREELGGQSIDSLETED